MPSYCDLLDALAASRSSDTPGAYLHLLHGIWWLQPSASPAACLFTTLTASTHLQENVDDFVQDEGEDLEGGNERDLAAMYKRQAEYRQKEPEMTAEDLEEYVKNRFQKPGAYDVGDQDVDAGDSRDVFGPESAEC